MNNTDMENKCRKKIEHIAPTAKLGLIKLKLEVMLVWLYHFQDLSYYSCISLYFVVCMNSFNYY